MSDPVSATKEIWDLIKETQKSIKELSDSQKGTDQQIKELSDSQKETGQQIKETDEHLNRISKELSDMQKDTDQHLNRISKELSDSQKETGQQMKETDKRINSIVGDFGNRWGKLGENLVKGSLVQRLQEKGIKVEKVMTNVKNDSAEFDIIAVNGKEVVVVEVKATLDPSDVKDFKKKIKNFKIWWSEFKDKTIFGAMAFLMRANREADDLAEKEGFFIIEATGDVIIKNQKGFEPKTF